MTRHIRPFAPSSFRELLGSTTPLPAERLTALYASRQDYVQRYEAAADDVIQAGFVLAEDRDALLGFADPSVVAP